MHGTLVWRETPTSGFLPTRLHSSSLYVSGHCTWRPHGVWYRCRKYRVFDDDARAVHGGIRRLKCSWEVWSDSPEASIVEQDERIRLHARRTQIDGEECNIDTSTENSIRHSLDELASSLSCRDVVRVFLPVVCVSTLV